MGFTRRGLVASSLCASMHPRAVLAMSPLTIRFYAEVTRETTRQLSDALTEREDERASLLSALGAPTTSIPPIHLHVNSRGGSLMDGLHMYDVLKGVTNVHTHVEGMVASAATLLTVAGSHRTITKHPVMLVHQPSAWFEGEYKYQLLRDEHANMDKCLRMLLEVYNETTTTPDLVRLIANEEIMRADECLTRGFVDEIL